MNGPHILASLRDELAQAVASHPTPDEPQPLPISPWVAMSLLQKSLRRERTDLALAAATLLHASPDRLWRRLGAVAFEDIGVADLGAVYLATAALAGKRVRAGMGGEWSVASFLVQRMAIAPKCRAADDLLLAAESHPAYAQARRELPSYSTPDLVRVATGTGPLPKRALARWFAIGTDRRPSPKLPTRRGDPQAVFDELCEAGLPHTAVEVAREGWRRIGEVLCPLVTLLWPERYNGETSLADDVLPPETLIGEVPSWAFDIYTREGHRAFQLFLSGESQTAGWVRAHIPPPKRVGFLGRLIFRVEGQCVSSRLRWDTEIELQRLVDIERHGPRCPDATSLLTTMQADLHCLNEARAVVC